MAFKKSSAVLVALVACAVVLAVATSGALSALSSTQSLPSSGSLTTVDTSVNLGVYANSACTVGATSIDWGQLRAGENTTKTVWIKNLGTTNAALSLSATGWHPQNAYTAMNLSWDSGGKVLAPDEVIQATLTLSIIPNPDSSISNFGFNIQITGTA